MMKLVTYTIFICFILSYTLTNGQAVQTQSFEADEDLAEIKSKQEQTKQRMEKMEEKLITLEKILENQFSGSKNNSRGRPTQQSIARTCHELHAQEPYLPTGEYLIDPDGYGRGDPPIPALCNMKTGTTQLSHDTESAMNVTKCRAAGCYSRPVYYKATMKQIITLTKLSTKCRQLIQYKCISAPLQRDGIHYAWWRDRSGMPQYYWAGSNSSSPTCQCGVNEDCVDSSLSCNCNYDSSSLLSDRGYLTNKNVLPVTSLHFGQTHHRLSWAEHLLGKLECSGQSPMNDVVRSCEDLWIMGHTLNGIYTVEKDYGLQQVYCDLNKLPGDSGFENPVGPMQAKHPIHFSVACKSSLTAQQKGSVITYDTEILNTGNAIDISTGIFTAPQSGTYFFSFNGVCQNQCVICLLENADRISCGYSTSSYGGSAISISSSISLSQNDTIAIHLVSGTLTGDSNSAYHHFTGFSL